MLLVDIILSEKSFEFEEFCLKLYFYTRAQLILDLIILKVKSKYIFLYSAFKIYLFGNFYPDMTRSQELVKRHV